MVNYQGHWRCYRNKKGMIIHTTENNLTAEEEEIIFYKDIYKDLGENKMEEKKRTEEDYPPARPILPERWDLLPAIALREVAEIMYRGKDKHPQDDWRTVDFKSEQSPLNRAIAHAYKASELAPHSKERTRQLAKAAARLLMQIWWELQTEAK